MDLRLIRLPPAAYLIRESFTQRRRNLEKINPDRIGVSIGVRLVGKILVFSASLRPSASLRETLLRFPSLLCVKLWGGSRRQLI